MPLGFFGIFPGAKEHQKRRDQVEDALVKEESIMPCTARNTAFHAEHFLKGQRDALQTVPAVRFIDIDSKRKKLQRLVGDFRPVYFLIGKIAPSAYRLSEQKPDDDTVRRAEKVSFFKIADQNDAERSAQNPPDDGKTAAADTVHFVGKGEPILERHSVRDAVKEAGGKERYGQRDAKISQEQILGHISAAE